jgi:hypothetical protein
MSNQNPDIVYMSELGRTGEVAKRDTRCTGRSRDRRPQHVLHGTAHHGTPYSSQVAVIIRVGPDGLVASTNTSIPPR